MTKTFMNTSNGLVPFLNDNLGLLDSRVFGFDRLMNRMRDVAAEAGAGNFPFYNVVKTGENEMRIELALAGYSDKDVSVTLEAGTLIVESAKEEKAEEADGRFLHRGISYRKFKKSFVLDDDVEIKGASMRDGMLHIDLETVVPEAAKPKRIEIKSRK